ncbi:hypothetical protein A0H81_07659 [Grifola frondosa]|uniref:Uncharacterized protein n=1 Tax=Grifola frondosa TaxID=5627 RepID=A0A1C7M5E4_GRIFR|nr:hypothetical protein A0H81_07659 [Grifola frondosa]
MPLHGTAHCLQSQSTRYLPIPGDGVQRGAPRWCYDHAHQQPAVSVCRPPGTRIDTFLGRHQSNQTPARCASWSPWWSQDPSSTLLLFSYTMAPLPGGVRVRPSTGEHHLGSTWGRAGSPASVPFAALVGVVTPRVTVAAAVLAAAITSARVFGRYCGVLLSFEEFQQIAHRSKRHGLSQTCAGGHITEALQPFTSSYVYQIGSHFLALRNSFTVSKLTWKSSRCPEHDQDVVGSLDWECSPCAPGLEENIHLRQFLDIPRVVGHLFRYQLIGHERPKRAAGTQAQERLEPDQLNGFVPGLHVKQFYPTFPYREAHSFQPDRWDASSIPDEVPDELALGSFASNGPVTYPGSQGAYGFAILRDMDAIWEGLRAWVQASCPNYVCPVFQCSNGDDLSLFNIEASI